MIVDDSLVKRAQAGDEKAAERLIVENSGLIWSVARRFLGRGAEPDDLYQLGCLGYLSPGLWSLLTSVVSQYP